MVESRAFFSADVFWKLAAGAAVAGSLFLLIAIAQSLDGRLSVLHGQLTTVSLLLLLAHIGVLTIKLYNETPISIHSKVPIAHIIQIFAQSSVFIYLSFYSGRVDIRLPLILYQIFFAINLDILCSLIFYNSVRLGFSALPIVLSFNLFLWFKSDYFVLQLMFLATGVLSKYLLTWERNGIRQHIFNPSGIGMFLGTIAALYIGTDLITIGSISGSYMNARPGIFMLVFLVGLFSQTVGRIVLVSMGTVATLYLTDAISMALFGLPLMSKWISPSLLVGATLLVTDPATTPKGPRGQFLYGVAYALSIILAYAFLCVIHREGYLGKILGLPFVNLIVGYFDRFDSKAEREERNPWWQYKNLYYVLLYIVLFLALRPQMEATTSAPSLLGRLGGYEWSQFEKR